MAKNLVLSIVVLILALLFVGLGWLVARAGGRSVTRQDLADESAAVVQNLNVRMDALSRQMDARADRIEQKLDVLLNIATNIPPDLRR